MMAQFPAAAWVISPEEKGRHETLFNSLGPVNGKLTGDQAKKYFMMSNLPTPVLGQIWGLSDLDGDGKMTLQEFMIGVHLIQAKLRGIEIPNVLPYSLKSSSLPTKSPAAPGYNSSWSHSIAGAQGGLMANGVTNRGPGTSGIFGASSLSGSMMSQSPATAFNSSFSRGSSYHGTSMQQPIQQMSSMPPSVAPMPAQPMGGAPLSNSTGFPIPRANTWGQKSAMATTTSGNVVAKSPTKLHQSLSNPLITPMSGMDSAFGDLTGGMRLATQVPKPPVASTASVISAANRLKYTQMFKAADHEEKGLLNGEYARQILIQSNVPPQKLAAIWDLADINKDGALDLDEFIIAMHLIDTVKAGQPLPQTVPPELIPPNKKMQWADGDTKGRSDSNAGGRERSLSITSQGSDKFNPATFEDRRKENFEKGRLELERRRKELQDKMIREKEERERKEREEEDRKRRIREEAEKRRQQEIENERRQREEMEREQENMRKKMIEQRLAAQLESERQRQREWEQRRKEELMNQKEHEEEVVAGLKSRLERLKADLETKTTDRNQLSISVENKKAEGSKLMESISMCTHLTEVKKSEIAELQSEIQRSRLSFSSLKEEREKLTVEINKRDTTTTSEALGGVRSSIHQMRNGIPRMKSSIVAMEAECANFKREFAMNNEQLQSLKDHMLAKAEENNQQKLVLEQKKRDYLLYRQRVEEDSRRKREEEERLRREIESKKKKEDQIRKQLEDEARRQKQREEAAMALEEQRQLESLRRVQEAQQADRRRKMEEAKKQAEEALKKQLELKQKEALNSQQTPVPLQGEAPSGAPDAVPVRPAPRKDKKAPPRPTAPPRPSGGPKTVLSELTDVFAGMSVQKDDAAETARQKAEEERRKEMERKQKEELLKEQERKRKEEEEKKRKQEEELRKLEEERKRKQEEDRKRKEEEERRRKEEEEKKRKQEEERKRKEIERLSKEAEEKRKMEQQAEVRRKIEEMQQKKMEKKQQQQQQPAPRAAPQPAQQPPQLQQPLPQTRQPEIPTVSSTKQPSRFKMIFPFEARNPDEISLEENDIVQVDEGDTTPPPGWLRGACKGKSGLFPANYAEKLPPDSFSDYVDLDPNAILVPCPDVGATTGLVLTSSSVPTATVEEPVKLNVIVEDIYAEPEPKPKLKPKPLPIPTNSSVVAAQQTGAAQERTSSPYSTHKPGEAADNDIYEEMNDIYAVPPSATEKTTPEALSPEAADTNRTSYENCHPNIEKEGSVLSQTGPEITVTEELKAIALYAYRGKKDDQLTFNKNDNVTVSKQQDMWWYGECQGKVGWFPKSYVKVTGTVKSASTPVVEDKDNSDTHSTASAGSSSSNPTDHLGLSNTQLACSTENLADDVQILGECVAIFDYSGQEGDLSFCEGDTISITKQETDWWEGYCNGHYGLFPANYVQIKDPEPVKKKPEVATVISPFTASGSTEISLNNGNLIHVIRKNPSGWWQGELQAKGKKRKIGWFPASHVKLLGQPKTTPKEQVPASAVSEPPAEQEDIYAIPQKTVKPQADISEQVLAIFSYTAQNEDELTFYKGSVINVINKEGEWWKGEFNGQVGMFPSNYVQLLSDLPDTTGRWFGSFDTAVLESMNETERYRQNYIYELIDTEQNYMDDLSLTLDIFYNPMAEAKILGQEELNTVFVNWKELIMCNMKLLKAMLVRKKMSPGHKIEAIGDILVEQLPRLTPYIRFCSCQLKACKYLQFKVENDPEFKQFEKKCAGDPRLHQNLPLSSYLLKPLQRLTKYPLMIKQILKYTPAAHYDRHNLELGVEKAEEMCSKVNENIRLLENSERLEWLQSHTNLEGLGEKLVFNSHTNCLGQRKFLHYSTLFKHKSNKELKAFLFNDFLLLCRDHGSNAKARPFGSLFIAEQTDSMQLSLYKKPIFLNETVVKMPTEPEVNETLFHLSHIDRIYTFRTESKNERNAWVSKLQRASEEFIETERLQRQKASRARSVLGTGVGKLLVTVIEGADLHSADPTGTSDPYCEVSMGSQEHKTKVIPKTLNPKWNSQMQFTIKDFDRDVLCITVFDRDFFSPNDFLGRTEISVPKLLAEGSGPWHKRLLLHEIDTGEILLRLEVQKFHIS